MFTERQVQEAFGVPSQWPRRINVRCCCQPTKILGTLVWDGFVERREWIIDGKVFGLDVREMTHLRRIDPEVLKHVPPHGITALACHREKELAFKAEGAPLELLRRLPDFIEGDRV